MDRAKHLIISKVERYVILYVLYIPGGSEVVVVREDSV